MTASCTLGVDHLTCNGMPPREFVRLAAQAGCDSVSLFAERLDINPFGFPDWSLITDRSVRREVAEIASDLGIELALGEGCAIAQHRDVTACQPVIDAFAELGMRRLNLLSFEPDAGRDFDQTCCFAALAQVAGLHVCLEFSARPGRPKLVEFMERIDRAQMANLSALIDAMHFFAAGHQASDLAALPCSKFSCLQLCDIELAAIGDYMTAALHERLIPGDGTLPLRELVAALPSDIAVSMEIPQVARSLAGEPHLDRLCRAARRCRMLLAAPRPLEP